MKQWNSSTYDGDTNIASLAEGKTFFKMLQKVDLEIFFGPDTIACDKS